MERALDAEAEARFWAEVRATMHRTDAAGFTQAVADGLEPEDWSDVL